MLGALCAEWSLVEVIMAQSFAMLILTKPGIIPLTDGVDWFSEAQILEHVESFRAKTTLLKNLFYARVEDQKLRDKFNEHLTALQNAHGKRNKFIHARWLVSPDYENHLLCADRIGPQSLKAENVEPYGETQFKEASDQFTAVRNAFGKFMMMEIQEMLIPPGVSGRWVAVKRQDEIA